MTRFKVGEILSLAEKDFEKAWVETGRLIAESAKRAPPPIIKPSRGKDHPIFKVIQLFREAFLNLGFEEVLNPIIIDEVEVKKQYGPEALAILDRCYYLATLPRPDVGISKEKVRLMEKLGVKLDSGGLQRLQEVLHEYKKGVVNPDDLVEEISKSLGIPDTVSTKILSEALSEFKNLKPLPTTLTLRSHMTSAWFLTLAALQHRKPLPIKLFSVDVRFRREQQEDPAHLRCHHAASCVIMDEELSVEHGKAVTEALLRQLKLEGLTFKRKAITAKYYAPETEYEVYVKARDKSMVEVANFGIYSPVALAHYGLEYPVLNVGIGVERVAMILYGISDVRRLAYPQFYEEWLLTDEEIARLILIDKEPSTPEGRNIVNRIVRTIEVNKDADSPCEFVAYEGLLMGRRVKVKVYEHDPNVKLVGPAAFNSIYVYDGNILGLPQAGLEKDELARRAKERGVSVNIRYVDGVAALAASEIEKAVAKGLKEVNVRVRMARLPSDVNIAINEVARRYAQAKRRRIDLRGPVFIGIRAEISS